MFEYVPGEAFGVCSGGSQPVRVCSGGSVSSLFWMKPAYSSMFRGKRFEFVLEEACLFEYVPGETF